MKKYFILFLVALLGFVACEKERSVLNQTDNKKSSSNVVLREIVPADPLCSDGVLRFLDESHLEAYTNYLNNLVDTAEEDGVLGDNEAKFDFISLRSTFEDAESLEDPFNRDDVDMSLLNSNAEIGVGNYVVFERLGERYRVANSNKAGIDAVRRIPKKEILSDETILNYGIEVLFSNWQRTLLNGPGWPTTWPPVTDRADCSASALVKKVGNECLSGHRIAKASISHVPTSDPVSKSYSVLISWGDGVAIDYGVTSYTSDYGSSSYTHEYSSDGLFHVTVLVYGKGECDEELLLNYKTDVTFLSCNGKSLSINDFCIHDGKKLELKLWNEFGGTSWNQSRERIKAKACTFKKKNGKWKRRRINKEIGVDAEYRNSSCELVASETDAEYKSKKKRCIRVKVKLVGWLPSHRSGDVTAWARLKNNDDCRVDLELPFCN